MRLDDEESSMHGRLGCGRDDNLFLAGVRTYIHAASKFF